MLHDVFQKKSNMADKRALEWHFVHQESLDCNNNTDGFFNAITIWVERPQVLNRRLAGSCVLQRFNTTKHEELLSCLYGLSQECEAIHRETLLRLQSDYGETVGHTADSEGRLLDVITRRLLPRESSKHKNVLEVVVQDKKDKSVMFLPFEEDQSANQVFSKIQHAYQVSLNKKTVNYRSLSLSVLAERSAGDGVTCPTVEWLKSHLLPKLKKWMHEDHTVGRCLGSSLRLVPVDRYTQKYEELKKKYKYFVKMWPERTDPHKFVYEDVAIATYLLLLWQQEQDDEGNTGKVQKFVDLGCGNGLLVYILSNEGHMGKGIDLRARKVWKFYDANTDLQVSSLDPSCLTFPDVDWLIGNHSDELTPWIPVIASKSSYQCKYFVLPCCFHDFYCKFQRGSSRVSQYRSYLNYIQDVGQACGFQVKEDVLRIPSTKRVCQMGQCRTYVATEQESTEQNITRMLHNTRYHITREPSRTYETEYQRTRGLRNAYEDSTSPSQCELVNELENTSTSTCEKVCQGKHKEENKRTIQTDSQHEWKQNRNGDFRTEYPTHFGAEILPCPDETRTLEQRPLKSFVPRADKEPVRNCTQLDKKLLGNIVKRVAIELLSRSKDERTVEEGRTWNKGGCMDLSEVSVLFDQKVLNELRSEAGGIKTVLRNSHQVFKVQGGIVEMRDWRTESHAVEAKPRRQNGTKMYWKTRPCWFYCNHPDGCPLLDHECSFAHGTKDLKTLNV